jgi:hypothetical protein
VQNTIVSTELNLRRETLVKALEDDPDAIRDHLTLIKAESFFPGGKRTSKEAWNKALKDALCAQMNMVNIIRRIQNQFF